MVDEGWSRWSRSWCRSGGRPCSQVGEFFLMLHCSGLSYLENQAIKREIWLQADRRLPQERRKGAVERKQKSFRCIKGGLKPPETGEPAEGLSSSSSFREAPLWAGGAELLQQWVASTGESVRMLRSLEQNGSESLHDLEASTIQ